MSVHPIIQLQSTILHACLVIFTVGMAINKSNWAPSAEEFVCEIFRNKFLIAPDMHCSGFIGWCVDCSSHIWRFRISDKLKLFGSFHNHRLHRTHWYGSSIAFLSIIGWLNIGFSYLTFCTRLTMQEIIITLPHYRL